VLGPDHPQTIACRIQAAASTKSANGADQALPLWAQLLPEVVRRYSRHHPYSRADPENIAGTQ
jgi:hypothetical protein